MALPSGTTISIKQIAAEVVLPTPVATVNLSLRYSCLRANDGFETPDAFSEFWGWGRTPTPTPSPSPPMVGYGIHTGHTYSSWEDCCSDAYTPDLTIFLSSADYEPTVDDIFYRNNDYTSPFPGNGNYYYIRRYSNEWACQINSSGVVLSVVDCNNPPSQSPTPTQTQTPSITPSITPTITPTPTVTKTPSVTPSPLAISYGVHTSTTYLSAWLCCSNSPSPDTTLYTFYQNEPPQIGDTFYTDFNLTTQFNGNNNYYYTYRSSVGYAVQINGFGYVNDVVNCSEVSNSPSPSQTQTPTPTPSITITPSSPAVVYQFYLTDTYLTGTAACADAPTPDEPKYLAGGKTTPSVDDIVYNDSSYSSAMVGNNNYYHVMRLGTYYALKVDSNGYINDVVLCNELSKTPTPTTTPSITPTITRTPSITPTTTPSLTISNTPSITPTKTPTPSPTPSPGGQPCATGLMAYWKLDESSGTIYDTTTNNIDSTSQSVTYGATGKIDTCLDFNGSSNFVAFGGVCRPTTAMSVSFWMKAATQTQETKLIFNAAWSTNWYGWQLVLYDWGNIGLMMYNGNDGQMLDISAGGTNMDDNNWHHFVITWNGSTVYTYYDNNKSAGDSWAYTLAYHANCNLHFGSNEEETESWYDGLLDEVGIWNRALTDAEVAYLYNSGTGRTCSPQVSQSPTPSMSVITTQSITPTRTPSLSISSSVTPSVSVSASPYTGTIYHITTSGVDTSGRDGLSESQAWATLAYACTRVSGTCTIYIHNGSYTWSSQAEIPVNTSVVGESKSGVIITCNYSGGSSQFKLETSNGWLGSYGNQTISNLTMDGNATCTGGIRVNFRSNVTITNCEIYDFNNYGIIFYGCPMYAWTETSLFEADRTMPSYFCSGNSITYCTITNNSGSGSSNVRIGQQNGIDISYNDISQPVKGSGTNCGGISFTDEGWNKNTKVHHNTIDVTLNPSNNFNFAIEQWYELGGCEYYNNDITGSIDIDCADKGSSDYSVWIHDNIIGYKSYQYYHHYGVNLEANNTDVIVEKNIIQYTHNAIYLSHIWPQSGYGGRDDHPYDNVMTNVRFSSNLLVNCGYHPDAATGDDWEPVYGINLGGQEDAGETAYMNNFQIYNNTIQCGSVSDGSYYCVGIWLPNENMNVDGLYIVNNIITGFTGGAAYSAPIFGTGLYGDGSTIDDLKIRKNIFVGNGNSNNTLYVSGFADYIVSSDTDTPIKVDPALNTDYEMTSTGSSAYHAGLYITGTTFEDYNSNDFYNPPSIGAIEYESEAPPLSQSPTPSITPSRTPSLSVSSSQGASQSPTPSLSVSKTPSLSISNTRTPSVTPTRTPSRTPSITPSQPALIYGFHTSTTYSTAAAACSAAPSPNTSLYTFSNNYPPEVNDVFYTDSNCTTPYAGNTYYYYVVRNTETWAISLNASGVATAVVACTSISQSPTPTRTASITPTRTPSLSISATPSLSISRTPSLSISRTMTPSKTPSSSTTSGYKYNVERYSIVDGQCSSSLGTGTINNATSLTVNRYYCYSGEVYYIDSTTTSSPNNTTITSAARLDCDLAAADCS